jgi:hypothetical protein
LFAVGGKVGIKLSAIHDLHTTVRDDPCDEAFIARDECVSRFRQYQTLRKLLSRIIARDIAITVPGW